MFSHNCNFLKLFFNKLKLLEALVLLSREFHNIEP